MRKFARKLLSTAIAVCVAVMPLSASAVQIEDFQDIPRQPWYYDYLSRATDLGLFSGTSSTTFSPEREITRAEAVVVLSRVHERLTGTEIEVSSAAAFQDVSLRSYYSEAVNWAAENKIVSGYGNRTFRPGGPITHGELAVMFHNYLRLVHKESLYPPEERYADYEDIPSWARSHVQAISGFGSVARRAIGGLCAVSISKRKKYELWQIVFLQITRTSYQWRMYKPCSTSAETPLMAYCKVALFQRFEWGRSTLFRKPV